MIEFFVERALALAITCFLLGLGMRTFIIKSISLNDLAKIWLGTPSTWVMVMAVSYQLLWTIAAIELLIWVWTVI